MTELGTPPAVPAVDQPAAPESTGSPWAPVIASWLTARAIVLAAFAFGHYLLRTTHFGRHYEGLLGWDADWYRRIAEHGYAQLPHEALRFFPLLPLLARILGGIPGVSVGSALLVLSNGFALPYGLLLHRLARREGLCPAAATRVVWVAALAPAGFVLVMGYAEPLSGVLIVGVALLTRARRWWPAAAVGLLAGALRPTGVVISVFILVEAARGLRGLALRELLGRVAALAAPTAGLASYLGWTAIRFGQPLAPFQVQTVDTLRGGTFVDPFLAVRAAVRGLGSGQLPSQAPHLAWLLISLGLLVVCARRLPLSYTVLAGTIVVLGATARDFLSYERYAASAVPLLLAAALVPLPRAARAAALALGGAVLGGYTVLASLHLYVP